MKKKIFVVEDDQAIVEVVKIILENDGYQVITTDSAEHIMQMIYEEEPHLILLDIWLSGYNGGSIAKHLKNSSQTKHIPIIITSANNETEKIARMAGVEGFLLKPFTMESLLSTVRKYS
jgi:DNA-binding response OmpR family regulator